MVWAPRPASALSMEYRNISVKGRPVRVPTLSVEGAALVVQGRLLRIATLFDPEFTPAATACPAAWIEALKNSRPRADVLSFPEPTNAHTPLPYAFEWDNAAV